MFRGKMKEKKKHDDLDEIVLRGAETSLQREREEKRGDSKPKKKIEWKPRGHPPRRRQRYLPGP